jgi:hypothetical protein
LAGPSKSDISIEDRVISLGPDLAAIPERLLLAHARGEVLFICGAGISNPILPDFRQLVLDVYQLLDTGVSAVLDALPRNASNISAANCGGLTNHQAAEVSRFIKGDYDVVLGMLERRLDEKTRGDSSVRREVANCLRPGGGRPGPLHRVLLRLADRGGSTTIVTTNFDLLLEAAAKTSRAKINTYSLGSIPRPSTQTEFSGVFHIHGALDPDPQRFSELVLSDHDFGEFYLRRRVVPDFIYDAARLFHLVLVGYSANDPPMRYLLNAVAADGFRFSDLKERFTFFGTDTPDPVALEDWRARGITPIWYNSTDNHSALKCTLEKWADFSAINGKPRTINAAIKRILSSLRASASDADRDLFDHLIRRSNMSERSRIVTLANSVKADLAWLDAIIRIGSEREPVRRR